jgi:threonine aldolase
MAKLLADKASEIQNVEITQKVEANGVFAQIPKEIIEDLQEEYFFHVWDEEKGVVRWMTSFDTTEEDIDEFVKLLKEKIG